jgi:hypothetical protein
MITTAVLTHILMSTTTAYAKLKITVNVKQIIRLARLVGQVTIALTLCALSCAIRVTVSVPALVLVIQATEMVQIQSVQNQTVQMNLLLQ